MEAERGKLPPPPGLVASLAAGFDSVANHIWVIILPLLFDLFLWLGPRLQLQTLRPQLMNLVTLMARGYPAQEATAMHTQANDFFQAFNLFSALRTFPVGTPSLLSYVFPVESPLGTPRLLDAGTLPDILGWGLVLVLAGWLAGAIYFQWVSQVALKPEKRLMVKAVLQTMLLSFILVVLIFFLATPAMMILQVTTTLSPLLGQVLLIATFMIAIWLAAPVFFSAHGIFTFQMDALRAILNSLRMARFTLPTTSLFVLMMLLISTGLDFLWRTPAQTSWWMLVGLAGHAFISTALLAASFIYYRDVNSWLKVVFDQLKSQANSARI